MVKICLAALMLRILRLNGFNFQIHHFYWFIMQHSFSTFTRYWNKNYDYFCDRLTSFFFAYALLSYTCRDKTFFCNICVLENSVLNYGITMCVVKASTVNISLQILSHTRNTFKCTYVIAEVEHE